MQIGSLPPRPSPREAGGGRGGEERGRGQGPGRGRLGARKRGETGPPAPPAGQGAAGRVCSPPSGLLRAGAPRLLLLLLLLLHHHRHPLLPEVMTQQLSAALGNHLGVKETLLIPRKNMITHVNHKPANLIHTGPHNT